MHAKLNELPRLFIVSTYCHVHVADSPFQKSSNVRTYLSIKTTECEHDFKARGDTGKSAAEFIIPNAIS